jgi:hypothetical protein
MTRGSCPWLSHDSIRILPLQFCKNQSIRPSDFFAPGPVFVNGAEV